MQSKYSCLHAFLFSSNSSMQRPYYLVLYCCVLRRPQKRKEKSNATIAADALGVHSRRRTQQSVADAEAVQESQRKGHSKENPLPETVDMVNGRWYIAACQTRMPLTCVRQCQTSVDGKMYLGCAKYIS